jgi:O-acetyl-ADP-ribose deacetylase (regulator of RNase III)
VPTTNNQDISAQSTNKTANYKQNMSKDEFPSLSDNNKPSGPVSIFKETETSGIKTTPALNKISNDNFNSEIDNGGDFIEKTNRKTDRTNNERNSVSSGSNRRDDRQNRPNRGSGGPGGPPRRSADGGSGPKINRPPRSGDNKSFNERFDEEKKNLKLKYKDHKENLCFEMVKGDLFTADASYSLAHCVSEDFHMGKGIATEFKKRFGGVKELLDQNVRTGGCAHLKADDRFVFYLVTKKYYNYKPYYYCLENSLKAMLKLCADNNVKQLAMPMIGAGLDKLEWGLVSRIIDDVFNKSNIGITVYKFENPNKASRPAANNSNSENDN